MLNLNEFKYEPSKSIKKHADTDIKHVKMNTPKKRIFSDEDDAVSTFSKSKKLNNGNKYHSKKSDFLSPSSGSDVGSDDENVQWHRKKLKTKSESDYDRIRNIFPLISDSQIHFALSSCASIQGAIAMCSILKGINDEGNIETLSQNSLKSVDSSIQDSPIVIKKNKKSKLVLDSDNETNVTHDTSQNSESPLIVKSKTIRRKLKDLSSSSESENEADSTSKKVFPRTTCTANVNGNKRKHGEKKSKKLKMDSADYSNVADENFSYDKINGVDSDSTEDDNIDDISIERKDAILEFFQNSTCEELNTISGCSMKKANCIIEHRPFDTWKQMKLKLSQANKLVSNSLDTLLWNVEEVLEQRRLLHDLMNKCADITKKINTEVEQMQLTHTHCNTKLVANQPHIIPDGLKLKEYQLVGLNWLTLLYRQGLNGVLADEMGLGKTVQAIAFIAYLHANQQRPCYPHVVVVPSSTLSNWKREFERWCPSISVTQYYGTLEERKWLRLDHVKKRQHTDVFLCTYNTMVGQAEDRVFFRKIKLGCAIFDEGHMLKNMNTIRYQNLMKISAQRRILLTGTPLQNNLLELMSLLRFIMPHMFDQTTESLVRLFDSANSETKSDYAQKCIAQAKTIMEPFVLRRLKDEVLKEIPDKVQKIIYCDMTIHQRNLYKATCEKYKNKHINKLAKTDMKNAFMELRKMSNHPLLCRHHYLDSELRTIAKKLKKDTRYWDSEEHLIFEDMEIMTDFELHLLCKTHGCVKTHALTDNEILNSGKFKQLDTILPEYQKEGKRVLMFSQFTMIMDIFESYLKIRGHKFIRLDGQTAVNSRLELIDKFNNDPSIFVFILSTKAGGLGINLTSASVVLIHDIDFNPYNDKQAEDRCHRLGQTQSVEIVRLITTDSIEERMLARAENKLQLEQDMINKDEIVPVAGILKEALGL